MEPMTDPIEDEVVAALQRVGGEVKGIRSDARWTLGVMVALADLADGLGFQVYATGFRPEWLFDMTWTKEDEGWVESVPLVLECEWKPTREARSDDFQKLMIARAEHRIMVLYARPDQSPDAEVDALIAEVQRFRMSEDGDRYLFACWTDENHEFRFRLYVVGSE